MNWTKIKFMWEKFARDVKNLRRDIPLADEVHSDQLGFYYIVFQENFAKLNALLHSFDEDGIPLNRAYVDVENPRLHYYPISIGQFGLALFHAHLSTNDETKRDHFLKIARWFYDNRVEDPELGSYWLTDIPKPEYGVETAWKSAFSQSRGISIMLRAYQLTGKNEYAQVATEALIPFTKDISENGVAVRRKGTELFYEEYVAEMPTRVLDGHIFSLFGLWDYVRVARRINDLEPGLAQNLFEEGVVGLKNSFERYDLGYWLRFNDCELPGYPRYDPCSIGYMNLIHAQFKILHNITSDEFFKEKSDLVWSYLRRSHLPRVYLAKARALKKLNRL